MYTWENAVITTKGLALLAKLTSGNTLSLVRAVTGAGYVEPSSLKYQSGVTEEKQSLRFGVQKSYPEKGECVVPVRLYNIGLTSGYVVRQIGVYAIDPDEGEILYLIAQSSADGGTTIPTEGEMPGYSAEWTFRLKYGQADGVFVVVDPANTVSEEDVRTILAEHASDTSNVHKVTAEQVGLGNVDNTPDSEKMVAFASEAAAARKVNYALTIRLNGGRTENSDMWEYDGSTSRTINVTAAKLGLIEPIESQTYPGCYYHTIDGEFEWDNPPMAMKADTTWDGLSYRTTERYNGKPVYVKRVIAKIPTGGSLNTRFSDVSKTANVIHISGMVVNEETNVAYPLPVVTESGVAVYGCIETQTDGAGLHIRMYGASEPDYSAYKAHFLLKYIKD